MEKEISALFTFSAMRKKVAHKQNNKCSRVYLPKDWEGYEIICLKGKKNGENKNENN